MSGILLLACSVLCGLDVRGTTMGTTWRVQVPGACAGMDENRLRTEVRSVLDPLEQRLSNWREDSEVVQFNRVRSQQWVPVGEDLALVVRAAQESSVATRGAFDITAAPLIALWGFGADARQSRAPPSAAEIQAVQARVGHGLLEYRTEPPSLRKRRMDLTLDLSGIAKGHAIDRLADHLTELGMDEFLIEVGGELTARGRRGDGAPWRVQVQAPGAGVGGGDVVLVLLDQAVATSGDYRNYRVHDGRRQSHIIDPRSGRPVTHCLASVTVLDPSALRADALATGLMVLGPEEGLEWALRQELAACFLVRQDAGFLVRTTPAFERVRVARGRGP